MRILLLVLLVVTTACTALPNTPTLPPDTAVTSPPLDNMPTSEPQSDPFSPQPGDDQLARGEAFIDEAGLLIRESYPPQIALSLSGGLPTPCHALRVVSGEPDLDNKIMVDAYSVVDPNMVCTQVIEAFEAQIELGTFPTGHYTVWVNGELAGEFDS